MLQNVKYFYHGGNEVPVMDTETREMWRWKFYRLALHLNAVILCAALTVMAVLKAPDSFRIPAVVILVILDLILSYTFYGNYFSTKAWLDEHSTPSTAGKADQERKDSS